jgi:hypothetical protein
LSPIESSTVVVVADHVRGCPRHEVWRFKLLMG